MIDEVLTVVALVAIVAGSVTVTVLALRRRPVAGVDLSALFTLTVEANPIRLLRADRWVWEIERLGRTVAEGYARTRIGAHLAARRRLPDAYAAWVTEIDELLHRDPTSRRRLDALAGPWPHEVIR